MPSDEPTGKCQNPNCNCEVDSGERFCSTYCMNAAMAPDDDDNDLPGHGVCHCGHRECGEMVRKPGAISALLNKWMHVR